MLRLKLSLKNYPFLFVWKFPNLASKIYKEYVITFFSILQIFGILTKSQNRIVFLNFFTFVLWKLQSLSLQFNKSFNKHWTVTYFSLPRNHIFLSWFLLLPRLYFYLVHDIKPPNNQFCFPIFFHEFDQLKKKTNFLLVQNSFFLSLWD